MNLHEFAQTIQNMSDEELQEYLSKLRKDRRMVPTRRATGKRKQQDAVTKIEVTDGSDIL